ncbi:MAG: hypothetical protein ACSHW0_06545 [Thalassotalea sp.]
MTKSTKAVLFSALLYPGAGHYLLKKYISAAIFALLFSVPLFLVMSDIIAKAKQVADKITRGEIPLNIDAISASLTSITGPDAQTLNYQIYFMVIIWVIAIVDTYRISRQKVIAKH